MICPVGIASDMSALQAARVRDHGEHDLLHEAAMERAMKVQEVMNPIPDISLATKSGHFNLLTTCFGQPSRAGFRPFLADLQSQLPHIL